MSDAILLNKSNGFKDPAKEYDFHIWKETKTLLHHHTFFEVFVVLEGSLHHTINGKRELIKAGEFRFIRPDDVHTQSSDKKNPAVTLNISFTEEYLRNFLKIDSGKYIDLLSGSFELSPYRLDENSFNIIRNLTNRISDSTLESMILTILLLSLESIPGNVYIEKKSLPDDFRKILSIVSNPEHFNMSIPEIIKSSGYSQSTMNRYFMKYMHTSIIGYIKETKMEYAKSMLANTNDQIYNIAFKVGYDSISYFNKLFKETTGMTPNEYRESKSYKR